MNQINQENSNNQTNTTVFKINLTTIVKIALGLLLFSFLAFIVIKKNNSSNDFDVFEKQALPRNLRNKYDQILINSTLKGKDMQNTILNQIINLTYQGNWTSLSNEGNESLIGSMFTGESDLKFMIGKSSVIKENVLIIIIKCLEGKSIDNFKLIYSYIPINKIELDNKNNNIQLKGTYASILGNRKIFKQIETDKSKL